MKKQIVVLSLLTGALWAQPATRLFVTTDRDAATVTGAPYSATAVTTSSQTLGDGTKITRKIEAQLARDSQGRTRREETVGEVGPWSTNGKEHVVFIKDPVAQTAYNLQPDEKTAVKLPMFAAVARKVGIGAGGGPGPGSVAIAFDGHAEGHAEAGAQITQTRTFTFNSDTVHVMAGPGDKAQTEDLGTQVIEGITVKGKRETQTIPVGEIGNDRAISIVSETWYSDELQMIVLSKHSDPRVGESEYKLTNISREEPNPALFEVPAGFTMREERRK